MNVNVKISLTDEQRNTLYRNANGNPPTKRMITRAEVNELVSDFIESMLNQPGVIVAKVVPHTFAAAPEQIEQSNPSMYGRSIMDHPDVKEEANRINAALLNRINRLQHMLDTK